MMKYCDFLQHFYDADRQVKSTLIAMNSQSDIARFFFELPFCGEVPEKYIFEGTTYKKWFTGPNKPRKGAWDAIEKNFDDACLNKCIGILTSKIKKETISLLAESFDITCSSPNTINKQNLAEAIIRQFRAIVSGHGDATDIVAQTYYSKEKPAVFGEYIRKAVNAYKRMTILGGKECLLDECYVCNNIGTRPGVFVRNKNGLIYDATLEKLKSFDRRAETKNTLLIANGGMGKSLMLQHLFIDAAEKYPETGLLPVFIELREFSFNHDELFDIIVNTVQNMDETFTEENAHQMLTAGRCQLLLDGIDEIDPQDIKEFQRKLSNFQRRYPDNQIVMTSRDCDAYSGIKGFVRLYLLPFDNAQSEELVNRLLVDENEDARAVVAECIDGNFIKKDGAFVSNPMMLTFVVAHCNNLRDLREKRYLFYKEAYEAIVLDHDKDKTAYERIFRSVNDSEEFTEVFQEFCAVTYRQGIFQ
ncbi:MAG: NACHT domain-containing protein, partial [Eubacteriales bacterium]|nr:NACHT domain-containing protein [Eubacteriales bacterium]